MKNYGFIGFVAISLLCLNPVQGYEGSSFAPPVDRTPQDTLPVLPTLNANQVDIEKNEKDKASNIEFLEQSDKKIQGKHLLLPISFTSYTRQDGGVIVSIILEAKTITANYSPNIDITDIESLGITADDEENKKLTQQDKSTIINLYNDLKSQLTYSANVERKFLSTLDLLINFFPSDQHFDSISWKNQNQYIPLKQRQTDKKELKKLYEDICKLRGKTNTAVFTANPNNSGFIITPPPLQKLKDVVGDPVTACRGRCGEGCEKAVDIVPLRYNQYTQNCFDHDLCSWFHGSWYFDCRDELQRAAKDYSIALDCPHYLVGTWEFEYRWDYAPGYSTKANWIIYKNGKFVVRNDVYTSGNKYDGKWELKNNKFVLTYGSLPGGTTYTGVVSENDINMKGKIKATDGGTGTWTAIKQTTSTDDSP